MRIASINMTSFGSTGTIMRNISEHAKSKGMKVVSFSPRFYSKSDVFFRDFENHEYFGTIFESRLTQILSKITGYNGIFSYFSTKNLIKKLKKFNPDIVHLHNIHNFCLNFPLLFGYLKKSNVQVVWTLHDCWAFTGHCPHFVISKCDKWKSGCFDCPQYKKYPSVLFDKSKEMYKLKKQLFSGLQYLTLVTPSEWLAKLTRESYLNKHPVKVINNGIDLSIFKPTDSDFRKKYNLVDKTILLGVSFGWGNSKGLDVFVELSKRLDSEYQIVLVGTNDDTDKVLPDNIISIHKTADQYELAKIYTAADLFINPTREDTFPTVNLEALACGTPVLTFKTGGSPECIDETCGVVIENEDTNVLENEIKRICTKKTLMQEMCIARAEHFEKKLKFEEYINLYKTLISE